MKRQKVDYGCYRGGRSSSGSLSIFLWILTVLFLAGAVAGLIFYTPMRTAGALFLVLALFCVVLIFLNRWAESSRVGVWCRRILLILAAVGVLMFAVVEGFILHSAVTSSGGKADAVIVLGAGVNGKKASLVLQSRIDMAAAYLKDHPDIPAVLSGGRGPGEDLSEAQCMYDALVKEGIDPDRLILEEESSSTAENFENTKALLQEQNIDLSSAAITVITNNFHCFRAKILAQRAGMNAQMVASELPNNYWWLSANYFAREFFALGKMELMQIL